MTILDMPKLNTSWTQFKASLPETWTDSDWERFVKKHITTEDIHGTYKQCAKNFFTQFFPHPDLMSAAKAGYDRWIRKHLEGMPESGILSLVNEPQDNKVTALHMSSTKSRAVTTATLLEFGANIDAQDNLDRTPLHYAVTHDDTTIIPILLNAGAKQTLTDFQGNAPIHIAALKDKAKAAELLIEKDFNVLTLNGLNNKSVTLLAVESASKDVMLVLIRNKLLDINAPTASGWTYLQEMAKRHKTKAVKVLLELGAKMDQRIPGTPCPIVLAIMNASERLSDIATHTVNVLRPHLPDNTTLAELSATASLTDFQIQLCGVAPTAQNQTLQFTNS